MWNSFKLNQVLALIISEVVSQCGYLVCTSAFSQGVLGSNPIATSKFDEVYTGLDILQPQWNPYPTFTLPPSKTWIRFVRYGTIHLRRQHVLGGEGCPHVPMVKRPQYIMIKNPLHKHFAGMPMVGG